MNLSVSFSGSECLVWIVSGFEPFFNDLQECVKILIQCHQIWPKICRFNPMTYLCIKLVALVIFVNFQSFYIIFSPLEVPRPMIWTKIWIRIRIKVQCRIRIKMHWILTTCRGGGELLVGGQSPTPTPPWKHNVHFVSVNKIARVPSEIVIENFR